MGPGESGEQIRLEVPLIHVPPKETSVVSEPEVVLMDVDAEVIPESVATDLTDPMSTDGRDVELPLSLPPGVTFAPQTDGPSELPGKKRRKVMFADE